jgi:uncharacterized protein YoxC
MIFGLILAAAIGILFVGVVAQEYTTKHRFEWLLDRVERLTMDVEKLQEREKTLLKRFTDEIRRRS